MTSTAFDADTTVTTEVWYLITWTDAHNNTHQAERPGAMAAQYIASLYATPGCDLVTVTEA